MANVAITPVELTMNTESSDLPDASLTAITDAAANQFVVAAGGRNGDTLLLKASADASGDTLVITAGDRPPSSRAGLGNLSITLAANDVRYIAVEAARFLQDDGTIICTCGDDGTAMAAFIMPKGVTGSSA